MKNLILLVAMTLVTSVASAGMKILGSPYFVRADVFMGDITLESRIVPDVEYPMYTSFDITFRANGFSTSTHILDLSKDFQATTDGDLVHPNLKITEQPRSNSNKIKIENASNATIDFTVFGVYCTVDGCKRGLVSTEIFVQPFETALINLPNELKYKVIAYVDEFETAPVETKNPNAVFEVVVGDGSGRPNTFSLKEVK